MLDRPRSEVAGEYWLPTQFVSFPFTSPPVRHRVPTGSERGLRSWHAHGTVTVRLQHDNGAYLCVTVIAAVDTPVYTDDPILTGT